MTQETFAHAQIAHLLGGIFDVHHLRFGIAHWYQAILLRPDSPVYTKQQSYDEDGADVCKTVAALLQRRLYDLEPSADEWLMAKVAAQDASLAVYRKEQGKKGMPYLPAMAACDTAARIAHYAMSTPGMPNSKVVTDAVSLGVMTTDWAASKETVDTEGAFYEDGRAEEARAAAWRWLEEQLHVALSLGERHRVRVVDNCPLSAGWETKTWEKIYFTHNGRHLKATINKEPGGYMLGIQKLGKPYREGGGTHASLEQAGRAADEALEPIAVRHRREEQENEST